MKNGDDSLYRLITAGHSANSLSIHDLFECLLGLNELETNVFLYLVENAGGNCCGGIGEALGKNRTSVQRAMTKLLGLRLVEREQTFPQTITQKGYMYVYKPLPMPELQDRLLSLIEEAKSRMVELVMREFPETYDGTRT